MKVLIIYDIHSNENTLNKLRKELKKYLFHVQFSVFEGELDSNELKKIKFWIQKHIDFTVDSVIIYKFKYFNDEKNKEILGFNKNDCLDTNGIW